MGSADHFRGTKKMVVRVETRAATRLPSRVAATERSLGRKPRLLKLALLALPGLVFSRFSVRLPLRGDHGKEVIR